MKKILMVITLLLCVVGLTGCGKYSTYTELTYTELQAKLDNKETFVVVLGSSTCSACAVYKETMEDVIKKNQVEIFYLDIAKLAGEDKSKFESKFVIAATPTTVFIEEGVETTTYNRIVGAASYTDVIKNLKKHGIIGE